MKLQRQGIGVKETKETKEVKNLKKKLKEIERGVDNFSEKRSGDYWRDVEHNINEWCSIWEDSRKAKAYRDQWNNIYKQMAKGWED